MTYILVNKSKETQRQGLMSFLNKLLTQKMDGSPDMHTLNPEDKNSIGIEEIKDFQKEMMYKPFGGESQVGAILEAEKLTSQAQNALLKTLEDSSDHSIFILCITNERNLLPTIRSRAKIIYSKTTEEKEDQGVSLINIFDLNPIEQFEMIEKHSKDKISSLNFINEIEEIFQKRLELDIKNGNIDSSKENADALKTIQKTREKVSANCNRRLALESLIVQLNA